MSQSCQLSGIFKDFVAVSIGRTKFGEKLLNCFCKKIRIGNFILITILQLISTILH
jgi:hypothetical protein